MECSGSGRVYCRSANSKLQELAYTSKDNDTNYHQRLFGKRHIDLQNKVREGGKFNNGYFYSPCKLDSLFNLCMDYIVFNLGLADSFLGLPSLIGKQIFDLALEKKQFSIRYLDHNKVHHNILLFMEAFGSEMLSSVDLTGRWKFLACSLDQIAVVLPFLTHVKLSSCNIGDDHEILCELGKMHLLECLFLDNNDIGERGLKNLTQNQRRAKIGLEKLRILDLSGNMKITPASLVYLQSLVNLKSISVSLRARELSRVDHFSYICPEGLDHAKDFTMKWKNIDTGWGVALIEHWCNEFESTQRMKLNALREKENQTPGLTFYKNSQSSILKSLQSSTPAKPVACGTNNSVKLCLCRRKTNNFKEKNRKRKFNQSGRENASVLKKLKTSTEINDDFNFDDLLGLYKS